MAVEVVHVGAHLEPVGRGSDAGSMRGPATTIIRRSGTRRFASGYAAITRRSRSPPTPEPPTVTMQTCSSARVAELGAQRVAVAEVGRVEAGDVAGEVVVRARSSRGSPGRPGPKRVRDDVVGVADEDRPVADPRVARDVLDHLGVVVGGQEAPRARRRRASAASRRSRSARRTRRASAPGSRAGSSRAPRPRRRSRGRTCSSRTTSWKTMKFATQDLVHPPRRPGSSAGRARPTPLSMCADSLARKALAGWIRSPRASSTAVTGCWASQSISRSGCSVAQLVGDRDVALRVAEPDRRRDVERALAARLGRAAHRPGSACGGGATNSRRSRFTFTGSRACGRWPGALERDELPRRRRGQRGSPRR